MHLLVYRAVLRLRFEISRVTCEVIGPEFILTAVGGNVPREHDAIDGFTKWSMQTRKKRKKGSGVMRNEGLS